MFLGTKRAYGGLLAALFFLIAGLQGALAADASNKLVRVSIIPIYVVHSHFAAEAQGYFAQEGIAVTTQPVQGGALGLPGLMSGSFDVLYTNTASVLSAIEQGIDVRIIAESQRNPIAPPDPVGLFKRRGDKLTSGKDLQGKTIAINAKFGFQWLTMQRWVTQTGGDVNKVNYREIPLPSMVDALKNSQADVALLLDPYLALAFETPELELAAWPGSTSMADISTSVWVVSGKWADANPDLLRAYVRAFYKGGQWVNEHMGKPEYYSLVAGFTRVDPARLAKLFNGGQEMRLEARPINDLAKLMKQYDMLKTDIDVESRIIRVAR